jgi:hypothetical protein
VYCQLYPKESGGKMWNETRQFLVFQSIIREKRRNMAQLHKIRCELSKVFIDSAKKMYYTD